MSGVNKRHRLVRLGILILAVLLAGISGCQDNSPTAPPSTLGYLPLATTTPVQPITITAPPLAVEVTPTPSPTPWLPAFSRVTLIPVVDFWWSDDSYLHYEAHDHFRWRYNPATREATTSSVETPARVQPSLFILSLIPESVPEHQVFFSPSGVSALFSTVTVYYGDSTKLPTAVDGEITPSRITSDLWYISNEEAIPRHLAGFEQEVGFVQWSEAENRVLLFTKSVGPAACPLDGWLVDLPEGEMWNLFPVSTSDPCQYWPVYEIAPDGQKVLFGLCDFYQAGWTSRKECEYWVRWLRGNRRFNDEPIQTPPLRDPFVYWLPNSDGLLVLDNTPPYGTVVAYLYDLETKDWVQLTNANVPYMHMDSITQFQFSPDLNYMAWNGRRGLQCFSLCPAGGDLLSCR